MDYSKITLLISQRRAKHFEVAAALEISDQGLNYKFKNASFTPDDLVRLSIFFKVPITYFFDDEIKPIEVPLQHYGKCEECMKKNGQIELLTNQLKEKDVEISKLNRELGRTQPGERGKVG